MANKMKSHRGACKRFKLKVQEKLRETKHTRATFLLRRARREREA